MKKKYSTKLINIISILFIIVAGASLTSCETECEKNCDNGYCDLGTCECISGWTGTNCDQAIGGGSGGNCTAYSGPQNCDPGYVAVSSTKCCSTGFPYHNSSTSKCYQTCSAATSASSSGTVSYGTGQTGSGGTGGGTGGGGGGSTGCNWSNAISGLNVTVVTENICGNPDDKRVVIINNYNQKVKIFVCVQRADGTYSAWGDSTGTPAGATFSGGYACSGTGNYIIYAEFYDIYWANNSCSYPGC